MRTIKTREKVKGIKVLDKSVNMSKRMKDAFIRTKDKAEETQNASHASPADYASDNVQVTARGTAEETVHHLTTPRRLDNIRHKVSNNWNRAKGHFQDVKRQMPKERQRTVEQASKTAQTTKNNAVKLRKTADSTFNEAEAAKTAVQDAKNTLKQVRQTGRQTLREVKQSFKLERGGKLHDQQINPIKTRNSVKPINNNNTPKINTGRPISGASSAAKRSLTPEAEFSNKSLVNQRKLRLSDLNPFQRIITQPKVPNAKPAVSVNKPAAATPGTPIKDSVFRPSYTNSVPKSAEKATQTLQSSAKTVKSTKKNIKYTTKGTVKTTKKSVKTAEKTAIKAVKTAKQTAKTAQKTAQVSVKAAKFAAKTSRVAGKAAVHTAKVSAKAITALVKATIAAVKGLVAAIAAGGWVAVLIILIICMIGLFVGSVFGIFFSSEPSEGSKTINTVIAEINTEYTAKIDGITRAKAYDLIDMSGSRAAWKQVLAVYTVKTVSDPNNPMEVATMNDEKATILRSVFWDMNNVTHSLDSVDVEEDVLDDDGLPTGASITVSKAVLRITVTHKTPEEMAAQFGFNDEQREWLAELLKPEYHSLWNSLLYGISSVGDGSMIGIADAQIGNIGGEPYWSWYGFTSRVEWCATFVSWVAEQCDFIDAGIIPRFSGCNFGVQWFKDRDQWQDNTFTPRPGDIIFFDWENDGDCDHVGIVESVADGVVNTIEGNTSDSCARRSYHLDSSKIYGYGIPAYN